MANWKTYNVSEIVSDIEEDRFVLPVIQRSLVWTEEKMELLFDTLLKGNSFGGIIVIEEEKGKKPLFNYRPFTKDGNFISSRQVESTPHQQFFVIDGQQRMQAFYIGLKGSIDGKILYFDLFSNFPYDYEFKFEQYESSLEKISKEERPIKDHYWYPVKELLKHLKNTYDASIVADDICTEMELTDEQKIKSIKKNVEAFCNNIIVAKAIGISIVNVNKYLPEISNKQRIVELFRRLNDGGTKLSSFELVASILKGFEWEMEGFLRETLHEYQEIGVSQDNLLKLVFILQDNHSKEILSIDASDADFVIKNSNRIKYTLKALKDFIQCSELYNYYKDTNKSFIPLFFIAYHLFHKDISDCQLKGYFYNYDTSNIDFMLMKQWLYYSLINGVFRSRGAGWVPYKTGIKKILDIIKHYKNKTFPVNELFSVYRNHPLTFTTSFNLENIDQLEHSFIFYLIYNKEKSIRMDDIDHIMPKSILREKGFDWNIINSIKNYQLIDPRTNRVEKNAKPFGIWLKNPQYVTDISDFLKRHLIPNNENLWAEEQYNDFSIARGNLILDKLNSYMKKFIEFTDEAK